MRRSYVYTIIGLLVAITAAACVPTESTQAEPNSSTITAATTELHDENEEDFALIVATAVIEFNRFFDTNVELLANQPPDLFTGTIDEMCCVNTSSVLSSG